MRRGWQESIAAAVMKDSSQQLKRAIHGNMDRRIDSLQLRIVCDCQVVKGKPIKFCNQRHAVVAFPRFPLTERVGSYSRLRSESGGACSVTDAEDDEEDEVHDEFAQRRSNAQFLVLLRLLSHARRPQS